MDDSSGIRIAISPVQLAAVLADKSISEGETMSNRLWGGLSLAGGVVEMFGAGVMCLAPDPTMLTKAGCVIVGTHSLDAVQAATRQVWTGQQTNTETYNSAVALAETLGADRDTAMKVGMTVDLMVPVGFAIAAGAMRIAAVRGGRIELAMHESTTGKAPGGHTLERHVGKTPEELIARLERRTALPATSSFKNIEEAEIFTTKTLRVNKVKIQQWVKSEPAGSTLVLRQAFSQKTGITVLKGSTEVLTCNGVRIVLRLTSYNGKPYFILTAFPEIV